MPGKFAVTFDLTLCQINDRWAAVISRDWGTDLHDRKALAEYSLKVTPHGISLLRLICWFGRSAPHSLAESFSLANHLGEGYSRGRW